MNQYLFLRRLRGPVFLLIFGVTAVLDEYTSIHYGRSWPLYVIAWGIMKLAENAILARNPPAPPNASPGYQPGYPPQPGGPAPGGWAAPPTQGTERSADRGAATTAIVPSQGEDRR